jgi:hypothetical protein
MKDFLAQVWGMLIGRWNGPFAFRFLVQPTVAMVLGILAGIRDAQFRRPPYGLHIVNASGYRRHLFLEKWQDIAKLFVAATIIDAAEQVIIYRWIYPGQALIIASAVAVPAYLAVRGPTNRIVRLVETRADASLNPKGTPGNGA